MTQVSDAALAIAADKAGIVGSISCSGRKLSWIESEIKKFVKERKHCNFILATGTGNYKDFSVLSLIRTYKPNYLVLLDNEFLITEIAWKIILLVRSYGGEIIYRTSNVDSIKSTLLPDYYTLKGHESAGKFNDKLTTIQMAKIFKKRFSHLKFICTGGLYTKEEIEKCFDLKASAVEIGTPFAISKESSLANETKLSIINNSEYYTHINNEKSERIHSPNKIYDLKAGVKNIDKGHVFIGKRASELPKTLRTVEEIAKVLLPNP